MRLPSESAGYELRVRYGRYVLTRLKQATHKEVLKDKGASRLK